MKSITLKTNNSQTIEYIKEELNNLDINNICFSIKQFKHFKNIIIHYNGTDENFFIKKISEILSLLVICEFEEDFLKRIIYKNYFYFSKIEIEMILNNCFDIMAESKNLLKNKYNVLYNIFYKHFKSNNKMFFSGFMNFRLQKYFSILNEITENAVNTFIIEKEYNEFISLLKLYISSQKCNCDEVHIIYSHDYTLILDKNKKNIITPKDDFDAKFLSDISFSINDYTLNTLLKLIPEKIYVHLVDNVLDEFIRTLSLIFENRLNICNDCNLCALYRKTKIHE